MTDLVVLPPPAPPQRPQELTAHGDTRVDDWYWLRDRDDPEVIEHLKAENAYADAVLAPLDGLREQLFEEIRSRVQETDLSVPVRRGPWWYYARTAEGSSYPVHCRRPAGGDVPPVDPTAGPPEQVLLDENELAGEGDYLAVANLATSPDHHRLAFAVDRNGSERYVLSFRALEDDPSLDAPETVEDTSYSVAWSADGSTIFYTRADEAMRPHQVWRHRLGTPPETDELVLQEDDERFNVGVGRTKNGRYVVVVVSSHTTSECRVIPAAEPASVPRLLQARRQDVEYSVEHHCPPVVADDRGEIGPGGWFVVCTNEAAEDFRVLAVRDEGPAADLSTAVQVELLPHRAGVRVDDVDVVDGWLVVSERADTEPVVRIVPIPTQGIGGLGEGRALATSWTVPADRHPSATWEGPNPEPATTSLRIVQTSLVTPQTVSDVDLATGTRTVRKRQPVLGGYEPGDYRTFRLWATAGDGTRVPISVVHRADLVAAQQPDGSPPEHPAPCLLYGYGAYEHSIDPVFSSLRLSLLDRGVVFAIAHVRGGGELGRHWYTDGKLGAKEHTVTDFVACAQHLVDLGFTAPERLAARGGSAGGLLMGAVVNRAPELFAAIVAEVPFVDCLTSMLDESLPLTVGEFEEWGDPIRDPAAYATIKSYSPYDNVRPVGQPGGPAHRPRIFVTAGLHDPRVGYWEPAKWVAKLRDSDPGARVTLRTELEAGHGGRSGRYDAWRDEALVHAFLLDGLGVAAPEQTQGTPANT